MTEAGEPWTLELTGPEGAHVAIELRDADGRDLGASRGPDRAVLPDLALTPGTNAIRLRPTGDPEFQDTLMARAEPGHFDPEPDDGPGQAVPIGDDGAVTGRLARTGHDVDRLLLTIPSGDDLPRDSTLEPSGGNDARICLHNLEDKDLQRRGSGDVPLTRKSSLRLVPASRSRCLWASGA